MSKTSRRKKILLVEDEAPLREVLRDKLRMEGFEVIEAHDGGDGVIKARVEKPDIILLDIIMPHVDGFTALAALKQHEKTKAIPVILLTNLGQSEDIDQGRNLGADGYLIKSDWQLVDIVKKIQSMLKNR